MLHRSSTDQPSFFTHPSIHSACKAVKTFFRMIENDPKLAQDEPRAAWKIVKKERGVKEQLSVHRSYSTNKRVVTTPYNRERVKLNRPEPS